MARIQTIRATHGLASWATRVLPVNMRAPTIAMEKPKSPSDPAYLTKLNGVSGMSWLSAALCSLVVSAIVSTSTSLS